MRPIRVLYPFDNNYAKYAEVSIVSLLENNKTAEEIDIYILGFSLADENKRVLSGIVDRYGRNIFFLGGDEIESYIRSLNMPAYRGAIVAAARLFAPEFFPELSGRVIYLDCDTIIVGDLQTLMNEDLKGNPVGMVVDSVARDYKHCLGFSDDEYYYNGGVILFDTIKWNHCLCSERIAEHIRNVRNNYDALDQDLLNVVLKGQITKIDLRYNYQPFHTRYSTHTYSKVYGLRGYYTENEIENATGNVVIKHCFRFLGEFPWHIGTLHPDKEIFDHYLEYVPNKTEIITVPPTKGLVLRIEELMYRHLWDKTYLWIFRKTFAFISRINNRRLLSNHAYHNM